MRLCGWATNRLKSRSSRAGFGLSCLSAACVMLPTGVWAEVPSMAIYRIEADGIAAPLTASPGEADRGRRIVLNREVGNCLACHHAPEPAERFQGDLGPDLDGVGSRLNEAQLRLRLVDASRVNAATIMPPYHRTNGLIRVAPRYAGRPALTAQDVEDVVAYLSTLKK